MKKIHSIDQFKELASSEESFFFLKHSLTCPISAAAYQEFEGFVNNGNAKGYYLAVQDSRELSSHIAETFNVRHESPQAFFIQNGKPVWHASHSKISEESLQSQL
ncbi:hypothetical protein KP78_37050 [Jeotgalibacillus soli]|uniref:Bacillithiol system protein YtxJ n=2 Tax=Jeotgalibacillus soli TaxID=889306 RepID=A0A0C2VHA2_9BACL|nr:hypothetical protein KP78_37050 [Jeotgalibacillus soli]